MFDSICFDRVWVCDFEYWTGTSGNEPPRPICFVAKEVMSGQMIRQWLWGASYIPCPITTDAKSLYVAFAASAEINCHRQLGWPIPTRVIDLYAEHRRLCHGVDRQRTELEKHSLPKTEKYSLLAAMHAWGLGAHALCAETKDAIRQICIDGGPFESRETEILEYCAVDVTMTERLLRVMWDLLSEEKTLAQCLFRGRYVSTAVSALETNGIPVDKQLLNRLVHHWDRIVELVIDKERHRFNVLKHREVDQNKFANWLTANGITSWPRTSSGDLETNKETLKAIGKYVPLVEELRNFLSIVRQTRILKNLGIGADGRIRVMTGTFGSITGRNQPSSSVGIWGGATWVRSLIRPEPGHVLWYCDFSGQELAIAACFSGDSRLKEDYATGDPYMASAKRFGLVPQHATKKDPQFTATRDRMKIAVGLGVLYGAGPETIARSGDMTIGQASYILQQHKRTYPTFWEWRKNLILHYRSGGNGISPLGWTYRTSYRDSTNSLSNWLMQSTGADMLRLSTCMAYDRGLEIVAMVHDAIMIHCPTDNMLHARDTLVDCMTGASAEILDGFKLRVDAASTVYPNRYGDKRGEVMWQHILQALHEVEK
jgi:DNA polymerase-1